MRFVCPSVCLERSKGEEAWGEKVGNYNQKEGVYRDGTIDEKVTVISSVVTYIRIVHTKAKLEVKNGISANFFVTEADRSKVNHIVTAILFDNSMT